MKHAVDPDEIAQFDQMADQWWDASGVMAPLHAMNPVRLDYLTGKIRERFGKIAGLRILDVGCGGGLVAEAFARLGAIVTAIDGAASLIEIAKQHAAEQNLSGQNLKIDYRAALTSDLIKEKKHYDVVCALEVIEHVPDQQGFIEDLATLVNKDGLVFVSTLNRTPQSFALGIIATEYLLRWLPRGTHQWKNFVKPSELAAWGSAAGLEPIDTMGVGYRAFEQEFYLAPKKLQVNYLMQFRKKSNAA